MEQFGRTGRFEFCSKLPDEDIQGVALDVALVPPNCFNETATSDYAPRIPHQEFEHYELCLRKSH
jgi:hypothetical protein